mmetsp:Transcript_20639/g.26619  ORF Transcript_20639/g.26619 Transcript_20639/m.26619 type:complete len:335 (+) Transcript_20639:129-1133(+)|eukprot:CAMPEP_0198153538 /NCGR_PEP_ID=MMETSP1443-20131203/64669_1 /TAXON_ID=186043 /ORGANISM="Entomoneis sp., Strain CCMP2396" /LENGTH=334 /DNA_ID=CAMNT_0043819921 /DNA_START=57 /DNA_END=1061 /DNA_ORIENTATION=-
MVQRASSNPIAWIRDLSRRATPDGKLLLWMVIGTVVAIGIPLFVFLGARAANDADENDYMEYNQQGNQQQVQNGYGYQNNQGYGNQAAYNQYSAYNNQNQNKQYNNAYNNNNNAQENEEYDENEEDAEEQEQQQQYGNYQASGNQQQYGKYQAYGNQQVDCGWFDYGCNSDGGDNNAVPFWWNMVNYERRRDDQDQPIVMLTVVYFWTIALLLYLINVVRRISTRGESIEETTAPILMMIGYSATAMLYLGALTGAIADDGYVVAKNGWYGQLGALLYMTLLASIILGLVLFLLVQQLGTEQGDLVRESKLDVHQQNQRYTLAQRVKRALSQRN